MKSDVGQTGDQKAKPYSTRGWGYDAQRGVVRAQPIFFTLNIQLKVVDVSVSHFSSADVSSHAFFPKRTLPKPVEPQQGVFVSTSNLNHDEK